MHKLKIVLIGLAAVLAARNTAGGELSFEADLVVYGGTSAGLSAAVAAKRAGLKNVVVLEPSSRIGGLTTGGLGQTDIGVKWAFGGIAREFYRDIRAYYNDERHWKWQKKDDYRSRGQSQTSDNEDTMWTFEPSAALEVLEGWERREGLDVRRNERLDRGRGGVTVEKGRITAIRMLSGKVFRGKVFVEYDILRSRLMVDGQVLALS